MDFKKKSIIIIIVGIVFALLIILYTNSQNGKYKVHSVVFKNAYGNQNVLLYKLDTRSGDVWQREVDGWKKIKEISK